MMISPPKGGLAVGSATAHLDVEVTRIQSAVDPISVALVGTTKPGSPGGMARLLQAYMPYQRVHAVTINRYPWMEF